MKKTAYIALVLLSASLFSSAAPVRYQARPVNNPMNPDIRVENVAVETHGDEVAVKMTIDAGALKPGKDREYILTPTLYSPDGSDSVRFESITVSGHNLYFLHDRQGDLKYEPIYRAGHVGNLDYSQRAATPEWLDSANLEMAVSMRNCCDYTELPNLPLGKCRRPIFKPYLDYGEPIIAPMTLKPKTRELSGRAYINFPVNRTELYPDYMTNPIELRKIIATIDSVKNDPDIEVNSIKIKGYASPEGSYSNNVRLAMGRTATLKDYVENMYSFPKGFIHTDFEPEDWQGLREYVDSAYTLPHRSEILSIINSNMEPDPKNAAIQNRFPAEYAMLLKNVYPWLRHSDYTIFYTIRSFTDPDQIIKVATSAPQKLSEEEIMFALSKLPVGSAKSNDLYETAARIFPDNPTFCLGAAISAISRDDLKGAQQYLNRAGDSSRAVYTRAVLAAKMGDFASAKSLYKQAEQLGESYATEALKELENSGDGTLRFTPAKNSK